MLTQFLKSINWVDVGLAILFVRVIFVSVKNGFITEFLKFIGTVFALFVSLHYFTFCAKWAADKTSLPLVSWRFLMFVGLWGLVALVFKFFTQGFALLFKVETNHQGFDKYAAGILGAGRAVFLSSLTIFALLLMPHPAVRHAAVTSYGYKFAAKAAPNTYAFLYQNFIKKLFEREQFNPDVFAVVSGHGVNPK